MSSVRKILVLHSDEGVRKALLEQFALHELFVTRWASNTSEALTEVKLNNLDLVISGVRLHDMDGHEACRLFRSFGFKAPIIMLAGHRSDSDEILSLQSGANDYVPEPYRFSVLLARIRAHLREQDRSVNAFFSIGEYTFWPGTKTLVHQDNSVMLVPGKQAAVLKALLRAAPCVMTREDLLHQVWGYHTEVTSHTVGTHIYKLRRMIEPDPHNPELLITEGGGYKLVT